LSGEVEAAVVDLEDEFTFDFLDVQGGDYLPEEQFAVEDLLVLELLVPDAFDSPVTGHQLALLLHLAAEELDVFSFEEVARARLAVAEVDAVAHGLHLLEQLFAPGVAPVLGVAGAAVDFERDGVVRVSGG